MHALLYAPARPGPLLEVALGPLCAGVGAAFGALLALDGDRIVAAAVHENGFAAEADPERLELLLTQGIAGYAVARGAPIVLRDISADPRWGPPSLNHALPASGAALALPLGDPAVAVLVLGAPQAGAFSPDRLSWLEQSLPLLRGPLSAALELAQAHQTLNRLEARDSLRRDLSAMALHDMRTPLQNIQLAFKAVDRLVASGLAADGASRAHDLAQLGQHSAAHLAELSKTLLDVARLEDDQVALKRQPVALDQVIFGAIEASGALLDASGCQWSVDIAPGIPELALEASLIERVLINLVENALKHTPPDGLIHISAAPYAKGALVRVSDNGPGIPPALQEQVFAKYFQIQPQDGARAAGVGLGLAFCRMAITAHDGEIWVESADGGGSVFAFTLPG